MAQEFLDFAAISKAVSFEALFNWLNIPFTKTDKELKGDGFVVNLEKNLYVNHKDRTQKGSPINFLSHLKQIDLRSAASEIKKHFITNPPKEEKEIPNLALHYDEQLLTYGITQDIADEYEIGLVKQRSIMSGKLALKVYNPDLTIQGYIGYTVKDGWYFPKNFKRPVWNIQRITDDFIFLVPDAFDALKLISMGYRNTCSLLGNSMTDDQLTQLANHDTIQGITLLHKDPMNIVQRVAKLLYIRSFIPTRPIREFTSEEFFLFLNSQR